MRDRIQIINKMFGPNGILHCTEFDFDESVLNMGAIITRLAPSFRKLFFVQSCTNL